MEKTPTDIKQDSCYAHPIILFDGVCNLCNQAVQFVIRHDHRGKFMFASLQSSAAETLLSSLKVPPDMSSSGNTMLLIKSGKLYKRSAAAVRIAWQLDGGWKLLGIGWIIPKFIRDALYNFIAKRRYKWFGKRSECMVPTAALRNRFLNDIA